MPDLKYAIIAGQLVKRSTGEPIPDDEPIFILRGRDRLAAEAIRLYRGLCELNACTDFQIRGCNEALQAFVNFAAEHPGRMKQPGCTRGKPLHGYWELKDPPE